MIEFVKSKEEPTLISPNLAKQQKVYKLSNQNGELSGQLVVCTKLRTLHTVFIILESTPDGTQVMDLNTINVNRYLLEETDYTAVLGVK